MATIIINQTLETAVKTMLNKHATDCVKALSEKYGFDLEEALRDLDLEGVKVVKKEKASPKSFSQKRNPSPPRARERLRKRRNQRKRSQESQVGTKPS